jgi:hypothetical protein
MYIKQFDSKIVSALRWVQFIIFFPAEFLRVFSNQLVTYILLHYRVSKVKDTML